MVKRTGRLGSTGLRPLLKEGTSEESKLDNILPKLQGKAGDLVFS